jgi:hypothetical protein
MEKLIDVPGPIDVETINSADWTVSLAGLLNLKSAAAQEAHLSDRLEPIHVFAHVVHHPQFGTSRCWHAKKLGPTPIAGHHTANPSSWRTNSALDALRNRVIPLLRKLR